MGQLPKRAEGEEKGVKKSSVGRRASLCVQRSERAGSYRLLACHSIGQCQGVSRQSMGVFCEAQTRGFSEATLTRSPNFSVDAFRRAGGIPVLRGSFSLVER